MISNLLASILFSVIFTAGRVKNCNISSKMITLHHAFGNHHFRKVPIAVMLTRSPPGQNGHHFANDSFECIFMNEKFCILIEFSLKFVPRGLIDNEAALVPVMAWHRTGDKPLPEPMLIQFLDICCTRGR